MPVLKAEQLQGLQMDYDTLRVLGSGLGSGGLLCLMTVSVVSVLPAASRSFFIRNRVASVLRAVRGPVGCTAFWSVSLLARPRWRICTSLKLWRGRLRGIPFVRLVKLQLGQSKGFCANSGMNLSTTLFMVGRLWMTRREWLHE